MLTFRGKRFNVIRVGLERGITATSFNAFPAAKLAAPQRGTGGTGFAPQRDCAKRKPISYFLALNQSGILPVRAEGQTGFSRIRSKKKHPKLGILLTLSPHGFSWCWLTFELTGPLR